MKKPFIICHMACSINGKIIYDNWGDEIPKDKYSSLYNHYHDHYQSQGWILGRVSLGQDFSNGLKPELITPEKPIKRELFIGDKQAVSFAVTFDTKGTIGWQTNEIGGDHIIAVLTEKVSDEYLDYLQRKGISYLFAGKEVVDLKMALHQLVELFSIEKIMLEGGGHLNGSFLQENLIDEVSLLLLPVADGTPKCVSVFESSSGSTANYVKGLRLLNALVLEDGVVWLRYHAFSK